MAPGFLAQCEQHFGTKDLYAVLGCESGATPAQLKKCYYKKSLELHPDTNRTDEKSAATAKFQVLSRAYSVLGDAEKRRVYDETGDVGDEDAGVELAEEFQRWEDYWRLLFPRVTAQRLNDFKTGYVGSDKEADDVRKAYLDFQGDMDKVMESVLFADYPDEDRIAGIVRRLIDSGEAPAYAAFTEESPTKKARRRRQYERELREFAKAEAVEKKKKSGKQKDAEKEDSDLASAIQLNMRQRAGAMDSLIDSLAAKYCTGASGKSGGAKAKPAKAKSAAKASDGGGVKRRSGVAKAKKSGSAASGPAAKRARKA